MQPVTAAPLVLHHALMTPGKHFVNRSPLFLAGWLAGWVAGEVFTEGYDLAVRAVSGTSTTR